MEATFKCQFEDGLVDFYKTVLELWLLSMAILYTPARGIHRCVRCGFVFLP